MCTSIAHPQIGKSETIHHAELYQENVGSKARMGASGYRDQSWEEGKHVDHAGEKGLYQPDNRVNFMACPPDRRRSVLTNSQRTR